MSSSIVLLLRLSLGERATACSMLKLSWSMLMSSFSLAAGAREISCDDCRE